MSRIHEGRLVVLLFCVAVVPVYFLLFFFNIVHINLTSFGPWQILLSIFINPFMYIFAWELWMVLFANRVANSYVRIKYIVSIISVRYNLYYGLTALFFVFAIVFPLVTPVVASLVLGSLVWRIATRDRDWDKDDRTPGWLVAVLVLVMIVPIACNIVFYITFIPQAASFWLDMYLPVFIPVLRNVSKALATAVTFGGVIYMYHFGTSEYELLFNKGERPSEVKYIRGLQIVLFFLFLFLTYLHEAFFNIIQYIVIGLNIIIILGNLRSRKKVSGLDRSIVSYLLITALFIFSVLGQAIVESIILVMSSLLYIVTFSVVFVTTPDE